MARFTGPSGKIVDLFLSDIRVPAMLASFAVSLWVVYLEQNINLDGILYMRAANRILAGDWQGAYDLYNWLFYPSLIALVSKASGLGLEGAAHFLNACLAGLLSYVFVSLVQEVGGTGKTLIVAALVIVFYSELNENSYKVIRGHGYLPFYLLALLSFVKFFKTPRWRHAVAWNVSMLIATLFRVEGVVFMVLLPFILLWQRDCSLAQKLKNFLMVNSLNMAIMVPFLAFKLISDNLSATQAGKLKDVVLSFEAFWSEITLGLAGKSDILATTLLNQYSEDYAFLIVLLIPIVIFFAKLIDVLTPLLFFLLLFYPFSKYVNLKNKGVQVLVWSALINVVILFTFLLPRFFLQGRYVMALALTLLVFLPFVLVHLYEKWQIMPQKKFSKAWGYYLLALLLLVNAGEALIGVPGYSHAKYIKEAGEWMKDNIPATAKVYSNNNKVLFYSGHIFAHERRILVAREDVTAERLAEIKGEKYDYLGLWVRDGKYPGHEEIVAALGGEPLRVFENKRKDKILVFSGE